MKPKTRNSKSETNQKPEIQNRKIFDLGIRTKQFAKEIRKFAKSLPKTISGVEDARQLIRSSGSIGANYIEAEDALSKRDFLLRIKISRKEAKETIYWLELSEPRPETKDKQKDLVQEATELMKIFGAIVQKSK